MATTTRKPTEVRRREIAAAALRVIGEQGAAELTTANLARAVGLTPGALFRHFASLDEVLEAAVERAIELVEVSFSTAAAEREPVARLQTFVRARVELIRGTPGLAWLLLSDQVYLTVPPAAIERLRALVARSRDFLLAAIRQGLADGSLRRDVEPGVMLILITGAVHSLVGASGVHRPRGARKSPSPSPSPSARRVLNTLFSMLSEEPS